MILDALLFLFRGKSTHAIFPKELIPVTALFLFLFIRN